jgi:hypothetical protein
MLFEPTPQFEGLPEESFRLFSIEDREARRRAILETIHPELTKLGEDLIVRLSPRSTHELHAHLPRLDWPRGYQPFCTWLALSRETHGYQAGPQLNVGVHPGFVAVRLGWDTSAVAFGRFEFLCRVGHLDEELLELARSRELDFRVFAAASWPEGSQVVCETRTDLARTFDEVGRRGVWWEVGRHYPLPDSRSVVCSPELGREAERIFEFLLPVHDRIEGERDAG